MMRTNLYYYPHFATFMHVYQSNMYVCIMLHGRMKGYIKCAMHVNTLLYNMFLYVVGIYVVLCE